MTVTYVVTRHFFHFNKEKRVMSGCCGNDDDNQLMPLRLLMDDGVGHSLPKFCCEAANDERTEQIEDEDSRLFTANDGDSRRHYRSLISDNES